MVSETIAIESIGTWANDRFTPLAELLRWRFSSAKDQDPLRYFDSHNEGSDNSIT